MKARELVLLLLFTLFFTNLEAQQTLPPLTDGKIAPEWTLKDPDGNSHSLTDYRGKIVLLDFWATWCGPCRQEMPKLQKVHEEYSAENVAVIGISTREKGDPEKFMSKNNYTYQLLLNGEKITEKYNVSGLPTLYIINQDGEIIYSKVGIKVGRKVNGYQKIVNTIEKAL